MRRWLGLAGSLATGLLLWRRRRSRRREHVDLYFTDGSMVRLEAESPEARRLLPAARALLEAVPRA
ncbi:MAG: hypothetical protein H0U03_03170 [Actinobacteria bacterium]|nr:hypothetical protein [Actinomycetota bacterium]